MCPQKRSIENYPPWESQFGNRSVDPLPCRLKRGYTRSYPPRVEKSPPTLMGDSKMFLTPPNSTMGGLLSHFFVIKRVLTICYRLETSYISILGLLTYIKRKKIDQAQRIPRMVAIFTAVSPKSAKIGHI